MSTASRRRTARASSALRGVSFRVERGTVLALLGPNGAGKTTTVKILATLSRPDAGTGVGGRHRRARRSQGRAPRHRMRRAEGRCRPRGNRTREPRAPGTAVRNGRRGPSPPCGRAPRPVPAQRGCGPDRPHVLGRHASQAECRDGARPPAPRAVPRRADDGAGPRGSRRHVGGDTAAVRATTGCPCS